MRRFGVALGLAACAASAILGASPVLAQKSGGVLRVYAQDSPASMSIHEEATPIVVQHVMGKKLVWEIDKKLQEDGARPIIYHWQGATCWRPEVKGVVVTVNSAANGWRWEDVWLDR